MRRCEPNQRAETFEHIAVDFVVLDQDAEPLLDLGEQAGDRHRIELGQGAEERRIVPECCNPRLGETQNVPQAGADGGVDVAVIVRKH